MTPQYPEGIRVLYGKRPGPKIGIMAIIHGDEPAGLAAHEFLENFFAEHPLQEGEIWLLQGNLVAHERGKRCVRHDMNRMFFPDDDLRLEAFDRTSFDFQRSCQLKPILKELHYLLDIHNTTRPSPPFSIVLTENEEAFRLATLLSVTFVTKGLNRSIAGSAIQWVEAHGGTALGVECGAQNDAHSGEVAVNCAKAFLGGIGIEAFRRDKTSVPTLCTIVAHEKIADRETFAYTAEYVTLDPVEPGALIATDVTREYRAPLQERLVILFPVSESSLRNEGNSDAYFLGTLQSLFPSSCQQGVKAL